MPLHTEDLEEKQGGCPDGQWSSENNTRERQLWKTLKSGLVNMGELIETAVSSQLMTHVESDQLMEIGLATTQKQL